MPQIIRFITRHSVWVYAACLLGAVPVLVTLLRARRSKKIALFGLELEMATARFNRSIRFLVLLALVSLLVLALSEIVEPGLPAAEPAAATPVRGPFTPAPTFTNQTPTATATLSATMTAHPQPTLLPQVTLEPIETPGTPLTPTVELAPPPTARCDISEPQDGSSVSAETAFLGTATAEDFAFYKIEVFGPETGQVWASLLGEIATVPVAQGVLGTANFSGWAPGGYSVRLVIVDTTSNEVATCYISVLVPAP